MVEQHVIQAVISSVGTFNGTNSKFESWVMSVENAAQILWQNFLQIAFPTMVGSPLMSAHRLRVSTTPNMGWSEKWIFEAIFNNTITKFLESSDPEWDALLAFACYCYNIILQK